MWRKVAPNEEALFLEKAILFTGNADLYGEYMVRAINEWPNGCEHNLSCTGMNRQAWIGHAAACIAINSPEYITRLAWWQLTQEQQDLANAKADTAIQIWENNYAKDKNWNRRIDSSPSPDFLDIRHLRENLSVIQRGQGQHGNVALGGGGSEETKANVWPIADRLGGTVQAHYRPCDRLF